MGYARHNIIEAQHRICALVVAGAYGAKNGAQKTENADEINRGLLNSAFSKGCYRNGEQLNTTQEKRQIM